MSHQRFQGRQSTISLRMTRLKQVQQKFDFTQRSYRCPKQSETCSAIDHIESSFLPPWVSLTFAPLCVTFDRELRRFWSARPEKRSIDACQGLTMSCAKRLIQRDRNLKYHLRSVRIITVRTGPGDSDRGEFFSLFASQKVRGVAMNPFIILFSRSLVVVSQGSYIWWTTYPTLPVSGDCLFFAFWISSHRMVMFVVRGGLWKVGFDKFV